MSSSLPLFLSNLARPPSPCLGKIRPDQTHHNEHTGEICIVIEGADGAPEDCPIRGPGASSDAEAASPVGVQARLSQQSATLDKARPILQQLIQSGEKQRDRGKGQPCTEVCFLL